MPIGVANNRIVVDTNVFISALIGQYSYPYRIFNDLILTGEVVLCFSPALISEYESVSSRDKFKRFPLFADRATAFLSALKSIAFLTEPTETLDVIRDEPDNRILELAVAAQAVAIVTGNSTDFTFASYRGISIVPPKVFYEQYYPT